LKGACSQVKRYPKVLCSLGQFLCKLLSLVQRLLVRVVQRRLLGGHGQLLQESTQVVALAQEALGGLSPLGLPVQGVHQPLAHHDHQLTLRDELLRRLAVPKAAHKSIDGLLESAKVKPAVLRHGGRSLLLWAAAGLGGVTLVISLRSGDMEQRASRYVFRTTMLSLTTRKVLHLGDRYNNEIVMTLLITSCS